MMILNSMPVKGLEYKLVMLQHRVFHCHQQEQVRTVTKMVFLHAQAAFGSTTQGRLQETQLHMLQQSQD